MPCSCIELAVERNGIGLLRYTPGCEVHSVWAENMIDSLYRPSGNRTFVFIGNKSTTNAAVENFTSSKNESLKLPTCEQLYIGCAIDGASCGCDGDQSKCRQLRAL